MSLRLSLENPYFIYGRLHVRLSLLYIVPNFATKLSLIKSNDIYTIIL